MDVFIKHAYAVILAQKNIYGAETIEAVTEDMIDSEIKKSLEYVSYYSSEDSKSIEKTNFDIVSHNQILDMLKNKKLNGNNVKLLQHLTISPKSKKAFYEKTSEQHIKNSCYGLNFPLFSSTTYISKNTLSGFNINDFNKKLYFLAHLTPYKPSYFKGSSTTIYMDLPLHLLIQYVTIFIEEWKNYNLNRTIETNKVKGTDSYYYPRIVNFPTPEKYYKSSSDLFYVKLYALSYFDNLRELAKIYGYNELYEKLGNGSIVEVNTDTPMQVFKLTKELVELTENHQLSELLVALKR